MDEGAYAAVCEAAARLGVALSCEELATLASDHNMGEAELKAIGQTFSYLAEKRRQASIETLLRLSRLPRREPKTFDNFDFSRIQGKDAAALTKLPALADLHTHRNVAFIGPGGIGKTHLAQAYARQCCLKGLKAYYIKATELRNRLLRAIERGGTSRAVAALVKPYRLVVDEVSRCVFDKQCTDLFFDVIDRRYEKEGPSTMILLMCNKKCAGIASRIEQRCHRKLSSIRMGRPLGARGAARSIFPPGGLTLASPARRRKGR